MSDTSYLDETQPARLDETNPLPIPSVMGLAPDFTSECGYRSPCACWSPSVRFLEL